MAYDFTKLDVPGALCTIPVRINDFGVIAGLYKDATGSFPFVYQDGTYTKYPQIAQASVGGINNAGQVIGSGGPRGRFMISAGAVSYFPAVKYQALPGGINSAGRTVGALISPGSSEVGFVENGIGGAVTTFDTGYPPTIATDINDSGLIVGFMGTPGSFIYDGRNFTYFNYGVQARASGISKAGTVVGQFLQVSGGNQHGFVRSVRGALSLIDFPISLAPGPILSQGASDASGGGWVVGYYSVAAPGGTTCAHGYLAKPTDLVTASRGCYVDGDARALPAMLMASGAAPASCIAAAQAKGFAYAGVQYGGQCFAGDWLGFAKAAESDCTMPCSSDAAQACGGSWRNSVYATGLAVAPSVAPTPKGCYVDTPARTLPVTLMASQTGTLDTCMAAARARGLAYAGLQFGGQCYGGNALPPTEAPPADCGMACAADGMQTCGGAWRNSVYATGSPALPEIATSASVGCYADNPDRTLPVALMSSGATVESCSAAAKARGYPYAGVQARGGSASLVKAFRQRRAGRRIAPRLARPTTPKPAGVLGSTASTALSDAR
jgi:sulfur relay (sulfurtransferase) complex TusBCD TusD component (DsrE family)